MRYTFRELSEEEIFKLSPEQLQTKIAEFKKIYKALNNTCEALSTRLEPIIENKLSKIVTDYKIKSVSVIPDNHYIRSHNKYFSVFIHTNYRQKTIPRYSKNAEKISLSDLEKKIYNELMPLKFVIKKYINFDISKLKAKNLPQKSEIIPSKEYHLKSSNKENKKYIFHELTRDDVQKLTLEQLQTKLEEVNETYNVLNKMLAIFIEKKMSEIIIHYDIKTVGIDFSYKYNEKENKRYFTIEIRFNDSYHKTNTIVPKYSENAEEINFIELDKKVHKKIAPLVFLLKKDMAFNVQDLRTKYMYYKFKENISIKDSQTKPLRYKI